MVRRMMFCVSLLMAVNCLGQTTDKARQGYEQFKKQARQGYVDFRRACNDDYAAFLKQAWRSYEAGPVVPRPKEREVKPVVMPQGDVDKPVKPMPVKVDTVIAPVPQGTQPKPVAPIYEGTVENEQQLSFTFFGTEGRVRMPALRPDIGAVLKSGVSENEVSKGWTILSEGGFDHLIRDCLGLRMRHQLCDWAYLLMLRKMSNRYYGGDPNASTLFLAWVYCQSGYQMRLGSNGQRLYLLFGSCHQIMTTLSSASMVIISIRLWIREIRPVRGCVYAGRLSPKSSLCRSISLRRCLWPTISATTAPYGPSAIPRWRRR